MEIYIQCNKEEYGPYKEDDILNMVKTGDLTKNDLVWHDELDDWQPLYTVLELPSKRPPPIKKQNPAKRSAAKHARNYNRRSSQNQLTNQANRYNQAQGQPDGQFHQNIQINAPAAKQGGIIGGIVCFVIGVLVSFIPYLGFFLSLPLFLVAFILSIVAMSQKRIVGGIVLLLASLSATVGLPILKLGIFATQTAKGAAKALDEFDENLEELNKDLDEFNDTINPPEDE